MLKRNPEKTGLRLHLPFFLLFFLTAVFAGLLPQASHSEPITGQPTDLAQYGPFVATGRRGMVVTAGDQASEAGVEMLHELRRHFSAPVEPRAHQIDPSARGVHLLAPQKVRGAARETESAVDAFVHQRLLRRVDDIERRHEQLVNW